MSHTNLLPIGSFDEKGNPTSLMYQAILSDPSLWLGESPLTEWHDSVAKVDRLKLFSENLETDNPKFNPFLVLQNLSSLVFANAITPEGAAEVAASTLREHSHAVWRAYKLHLLWIRVPLTLRLECDKRGISHDVLWLFLSEGSAQMGNEAVLADSESIIDDFLIFASTVKSDYGINLFVRYS